MLPEIKSYLLYGNQFCGIEHTSHFGNEIIKATTLKKSKKELKIDKTLEANTIEELSKTIPKNTHAFLVINNENVLTKRLKVESKDDIKLVNQAFPNININDFMYEVIVQKDVHFISICRRSYIEGVIESYKSNGVDIVNVSLGNLIIVKVIGFIKENIILTTNAKVEVSNNEITEIITLQTEENTKYDINGLETNRKWMLSLSAALSSALSNRNFITNFEAEKQKLRTAYGNTVFFRKFLAFALVLLFSSLLINFLAFNHYFNKVNTLQQASQVNQETKVQITELNEKVLKSQKMVDDLLNNNNSKSSYFINDIIQELPESIKLNEFEYQPLLKRIKPEEAIKNEALAILVSGESVDSDIFSIWISKLEKRKWLTIVEVTDYADMSLTVSNFKFKIYLKP